MKKIFKTYFLLFILSFIQLNVNAQNNTQTIRGKVIDAQSKTGIEKVKITLQDSIYNLSCISDSLGYFELKQVPLGRLTFKINAKEYAEQTISNILVTSGKEIILNIELVENIATVGTASVKGKKNKVNNSTISVSVKSFDVEDTRRFAGSRNDPARMASNFAGVVGNNDSRNDIVIRGNSPQGVLWRLDGVDIPNPSHFGALGATGGPVSILNNNVLAKSDFITSAFPAMYGNANAGVFDLQMRNGNNAKSEITGQIGFNGFEMGAEGPFSKKNKASYMVYYRYSTLAVMQKAGFNFGTGTAVPYYQDIAFKVNIPIKKNQLTFFGIGGKSNIDFIHDKNDTANFFSNGQQDLRYRTNMGVAGMSYLYFINKSAYIKTTIATTYTGVKALIDSISPSETAIPFYRDNSTLSRSIAHIVFNKKFSAKQNISLGIIAQQLGFNFNDSVLTNGIAFRPLRELKGSSGLHQIYAQWQYKFSNRLILNTGLHFQYLSINNTNATEPRIGLTYAINKKHSISTAAGLHSQIQPLQMYFLNTQVGNNQVQTNKNLEFTKSMHYVLSHNYSINKFWQLKTELYYQSLYNVPVHVRSNYYSTLNEGADFNTPSEDSLVNNGIGTNKGIELTLEKYFDKGFYLLNSISIYDAKYKGSNGIEKNTAFNGGYIVNILAGKEIKLSTKNTLALDAKITTAGGRRYTPINISSSALQGREIREFNKSFDLQFKPYFRTDFKVTFRRNGKKISQEWFIDMQNITNHQNVFAQSYDNKNKKLVTQFQLGLYPVFNYRINF